MLRTELFSMQAQNPPIEPLGLYISPLGLIEQCQIIENGTSLQVFRALSLFLDRQSTLIQWFCLCISPLVIIDKRQRIQRVRCFRMLWSQDSLSDCQSTL